MLALLMWDVLLSCNNRGGLLMFMKKPGFKRKEKPPTKPTHSILLLLLALFFFSSGNILYFEGWIQILQVPRTSWEVQLWCAWLLLGGAGTHRAKSLIQD